jgi:hypothetical protein
MLEQLAALHMSAHGTSQTNGDEERRSACGRQFGRARRGGRMADFDPERKLHPRGSKHDHFATIPSKTDWSKSSWTR